MRSLMTAPLTLLLDKSLSGGIVMSIFVSTGGFGAAGGFGDFAGGATGFAPFFAVPLTTGFAGGTIGFAADLPALIGAGRGGSCSGFGDGPRRCGLGSRPRRYRFGLRLLRRRLRSGNRFLGRFGNRRGRAWFHKLLVIHRYPAGKLRQAVARLLTVDHFRRNGREGMLTSVL